MPVLRYRVAAGAAARPITDLVVHLAEDATVGEVADAVADHLDPTGLHRPSHPTLAAVDHDADGAGSPAVRQPAGRDRPAMEGAPRCGSTVALVPDGAVREEPPWQSPVTLHPVDPASGPVTRLCYGTTRIAREPSTALEIEVGADIVVRITAGVASVLVDGAPVLGGMGIRPGALLTIGNRTVEVRCGGPLRPPDSPGPTRLHERIPSRSIGPAPDPVELPTAPAAHRTPAFPVLSAMVPLLMGVALWLATASVAVAGFVVFSFVFVVAAGLESRRESRAETRFREAEFRADLDRATERIDRHLAQESDGAERATPSVSRLSDWVATAHPRLWERPGDEAGALVARIGRAPQQPRSTVVAHTNTGRWDLRRELLAVADRVATTDLPVHVDLADTAGLAVVGPGEGPAAVARSVVCQLAALVDPDHLTITVDTSADRAPLWRWVQWLPHAVPATTATAAVTTIVVVDRSTAREARTAVADLTRTGAVPVVVARTPAGLPESIGAVLRLGGTSSDPGAGATLRMHRSAPVPLRVEDLSLDGAEVMARRLSPLRPCGDRGTALPPAVPLSRLLADPTAVTDPTAMARQWQGSAPDGLRVPVGVAGGGVLSLDLGTDGPHGLVAGTTGAGKSELLRTLVASLALHHGPHRVTFLLVDYKGGSAFRSLDRLPHSVGLVTDLTPTLADRALVSLQAELRHRERLVAAGGVTDLRELAPAGRPPALVVVVDEFAALAREVPEFVEGIVDLAQRGRSLGVHLLLATQRPAGVVTDAIRANTTLRVALRVADEDDSADVVDSVRAAHLPRDLPGRAVMRTGPRRTTDLQVAHTGGPPRPPRRVTCIPFGHVAGAPPDEPGRDGPTQLDAVIATARAAAVAIGTPPPRRPWLDPLPAVLDPAEVLSGPPAAPGCLAIGRLDRPRTQSQPALVLDLATHGSVLVQGCGGSGRTSTLAMLARAATAHPECVHVHALDGGRGLAPLHHSGAVGEVVGMEDLGRTLRLLRMLSGELARRRGPGPPVGSAGRPRLLVLVDGLGTLEDLHARVNRGEALDLLTRLAREGRAAGIHVVGSATRRAEVPAPLAAALHLRLLLRCAGPDEAVLAGAPEALGDRDLPPGRGLVDGDWFQVAHHPPGAPAGGRTGRGPTPATVPPLPDQVPDSALPAPRGTWDLPVGISSWDLQVVALDLTDRHALVAGPPRSGRSAALQVVADVASRAHLPADVVRVDGRSTEADAAARALRQAAARGRDGRPVLVLVDDLTDLLDRPDGAPVDDLLLELLDLGRSAPVRVVAAAEADALARCYAESARRLRAGRGGLLLRPDPDLHPSLLHTTLPPHDDLVMGTGHGWSVTPERVTPLQMAWPDDRVGGR